MRLKAQCIFEAFNLKFLKTRQEISELLHIDSEGNVPQEFLDKVGAESALLAFDHLDRFWQAKVYYVVDGHEEAQALLERMSEDYRFQIPTARVAFDLTNNKVGEERLYVRYTEINVKRIYFHHLMAVGAAKQLEEEKRALAIKEKEEEDYIPSGPLIF